MTEQWEDDHILTADDIAWLMDQGACRDALNYLGSSVADAVAERPAGALAYAASRLPDDVISRVARLWPAPALAYASDRLTDDQFKEAARREAKTAWLYASARCDKLLD